MARKRDRAKVEAGGEPLWCESVTLFWEQVCVSTWRELRPAHGVHKRERLLAVRARGRRACTCTRTRTQSEQTFSPPKPGPSGHRGPRWLASRTPIGRKGKGLGRSCVYTSNSLLSLIQFARAAASSSREASIPSGPIGTSVANNLERGPRIDRWARHLECALAARRSKVGPTFGACCGN